MPRLSTWFVRAALIYLLLGFVLGGLILAQKGLPYYAPVWQLLPLHIEFLISGWMIQLAMGVAFWILPRFSSGDRRGNERLVGASFLLLNVGILLIACQPWFGAAAISGHALELASI